MIRTNDNKMRNVHELNNQAETCGMHSPITTYCQNVKYFIYYYMFLRHSTYHFHPDT